MNTITNKLAHLLSFALLAGLVPVMSLQAEAGQPRVGEKARGAFPVMNLGQSQAAGQTAIDRLGARLADVASWYGKSPQQLRGELLSDRRMRLDKSGRLLAVEELEAPIVATADAQAAIQDGALVSLDQTFALHSRPGASRTVYLDFNGATVANTAWNSNGNTITAQPYDLDGNSASFSTTELQRIQYIWQRVAEDYSPFDVDITTEEPAPEKIARADANDQIFGTTVVITKTDGVYSCSCGGIAYVGVFNYVGSEFYKPAFVFFNMLGSGAEKPVAEAISHEAGHNMGLHHDGTSTQSYYAGQGTDAATGWAPIMGVGYYKPVVQFSKGEYGDANNGEDDFAVAQSFGLPLRADDHGSSIATARQLQPTLAGGTASASIDGVIEQAGDRDVFAIESGAGNIDLSVVPASRSPNADLVLTLSDASGRVLATQNALNALDARLSVNVPSQGTYFLEVRGTGQGDPATTGYSSYGSTGSFRVSANYPIASGSAPSALLTASVTTGTGPLAVTFDGAQSTDDGHVAFWYWDFGDGNTDQSGSLSSVTHVYQTPGTYAARLTVVDNSGLSASTSVVVAVTSAVAQPGVQIVGMSLKQTKRGVSANALVNVTGPNGEVIRGAKVQVTWGGVVSKVLTKKAAASGTANFLSPASKTAGCFTLTVTGIAAAGYSFGSTALPSAQLCV